MAHEEIRHYESLTQQIQRIHHSHSRAPSSCMVAAIPKKIREKKQERDL